MGAFRDFWLGTPQQPVNEIEVRVDQQGEPSPGILPPARILNENVQPREAIKVGTVYRSVSIISTMVSQMHLDVYRDGKKIKTPALIANPIEGESQCSFVQQCVWSLALWGNAYVRLYGTPVSSVEVLDPDAVVVDRDESGRARYWINGKVVDRKKICHMRLDRLPGALLGHGPLQGAVGELRAAIRLDKFMQTWFNTEGIPKGVITTSQQLNPEASRKFIEAWEAFVNEHKNIIMPLGMKYEQLAAKPIELQFQDVAEANVRNIARIFGIPAANLLSSLEGSSMTYTNYIESNLQFMQNTLSRYMNEIEHCLSELLPRSQYVKFNEDELLRMSPEKVWAIKKVQAEVGYYSGEEQREQEGLPPLKKVVDRDPADAPAEKLEGGKTE